MKFLAEDGQLIIKLEGWEIFWGLKRRLILPRKNIIDLQWTSEFDTSDLMLRIGGSNVPRILLAGHFRDMDTKENLYLYLRQPHGFTLARSIRDTNVLVVTLQDFTYGKIIVNCDAESGAHLMNWFALSKSQEAES